MYRYSRYKSKFKKIIGLIILIIAVATISIFAYDFYINIDVDGYSQGSDGKATRISATQEIDSDDDEEIMTTLEDVTKCVVGISKIKNAGTSIFTDNSTETLGLGTGIIVSDNGYILTNWHVVGNKYSTCYVTLEDGSVYNGKVAWVDTDLDLAILKIEVKGLNYMVLGDSDSIRLGQPVYAIGNPIGVEFQRTVTAGIISGLNRTIKIEEDGSVSYMEDLVQTDATINPGNSGGPLINKQGEVVGVNSVKITSAEGIGFAIPINIVKPVVESFAVNGKFEEAYLGIFAYDEEVIPYLDSNIQIGSGVYVAQISVDGPCNSSELKVGDVITKIDGQEINQMSELRQYVYTKKPNDKVKLTVIRNNKEYSIDIVLGKKI